MATKDLLITILGLLGLAWLLQPKEIRPGQEQAHSMTPQVVPAQSHVQVNEPVSAPVIQSVSPKPSGVPAPPSPTPIQQNTVPTIYTTPQVISQQSVVSPPSTTQQASSGFGQQPVLSSVPSNAHLQDTGVTGYLGVFTSGSGTGGIPQIIGLVPAASSITPAQATALRNYEAMLAGGAGSLAHKPLGVNLPLKGQTVYYKVTDGTTVNITGQ